jgi:hypothetical protein
MGFVESINRAFFNMTYNEKASQAYDEQNQKAATAVDDIKKQIQGYRDARDRLLASNKATGYFSTNSLARITEWENWLGKNGGLAAGDYTAKSTEMKTQWDSIYNSNKIVQEMERIPSFLELFMKDKEGKIPAEQKKELIKLKEESEKYLKNMNTQTPAELLAKRDDYNRQFMEIQKKIPENFEDLKEGYESEPSPQATLFSGIEENNYNDYKNQVEQKEQAEEDTFKPSRILTRASDYFSTLFSALWRWVVGVIFAIIVANDMIGRPFYYRIFYAFYTIVLCQYFMIPGVIPVVLFLYYIVRVIQAIIPENFFSFDPQGPRMNYLSAPVLFNVLPLMEASKTQVIPWWISIITYDPNLYGGLAAKKRIAYEMEAAELVGKKVSGLNEATLNEILCELKSAVLGIEKDKFTNVITSLKALVT